MKKKISAIILVLTIMVSALPLSASAHSFTDVLSGIWYEPAVNYAVENNLFSGKTPTTFAPMDEMSRGEFVTVLGRKSGVPNTYGQDKASHFGDVPKKHFSYPYAVWAYDNNIVSGTGNGNFNPDGKVERQQIASILYEYAIKTGNDTSYSSTKFDSFYDKANVSSYALEAMKWATTHNVLQGSAGMLTPRGKANRAQVAQIFYNTRNLLTKTEIIGSGDPDEPDEDDLPTDVDELLLMAAADRHTMSFTDWIMKYSKSPLWQDLTIGYGEESFFYTHGVLSKDFTYDRKTGKSAVDADGGYYDYDLANEIMDLIDELRVERGLGAMKYHPQIQEWSSIRAKEFWELWESLNFPTSIPDSIAHTRPDGSDARTVGHSLTLENLDRERRSEHLLNASMYVTEWYNSSGHRIAMLAPGNMLAAVSCYIREGKASVCHLFSDKNMAFFEESGKYN